MRWCISLPSAIGHTVTVGFATTYFMAVTYGAPLFEQVAETAAMSLLLAVLCFFPASLLLGLEWWFPVLDYLFDGSITTPGRTQGSPSLTDVEHSAYVRWVAIYEASVFAGLFIGAAALPLDWDRWWQRWPLPCAAGSILGGLVGAVAATGVSWLLPRPSTVNSRRLD